MYSSRLRLSNASWIAISLCIMTCTCLQTHADVVVLVSDDDSGLLFEWSGNLELAARTETGTFTGPFNWMTPSVPRMHGLTGTWDYYDFESLVLAPYGSGTGFLKDGLKTGDSFGITIPSGDPGKTPGRLYVPSGYTNQTLHGSLLFTGETMASQGIDLSSPVEYDFGTVGTVTFQAAVPEPSSFVVSLVALVGFFTARFRGITSG